MPKQKKGQRHPTGTYNGINYYYVNGELITRKAGGGFTSEGVKKDPKYEKTRQSNSEMAVCSRFVRDFKVAIAPLLEEFHDSTLHRRLMSLFLGLRKLDKVSVEGNRHPGVGLNTPKGRRDLRDFRFTPGLDIKMELDDRPLYDPETGVLTIPKLNTKTLRFSKGSTHVGFHYGVLTFDPKLQAFGFISGESAILAEDSGVHDVRLALNEPLPEDLQSFPMLRMQFCEQLEDALYPLYGKRAVGIGVV